MIYILLIFFIKKQGIENMLTISEVAKEVKVESHVLRYWEDELGLTIARNEMGHRSYSEEDLKLFIRIKELKERGLQLKAVKALLQEEKGLDNNSFEVTNITPKQEITDYSAETDKGRKIKFILQNIVREAVEDSNQTLIKELDYQFRLLEERDDRRNEEYYKKIDELMRMKSKKNKLRFKK